MNAPSTVNENSNAGTGSPQDELRAHLRGMWASVSGGWAEHADLIDARSAHLTERMLDAAHVDRGQRVVELACGPGRVGLAAAQRIGPDGEVVVSDVAAEMAEIAGARARAAGLEQVTACVRDLEAIDDPDGSYDAVLCREGLVFAPEP